MNPKPKKLSAREKKKQLLAALTSKNAKKQPAEVSQPPKDENTTKPATKKTKSKGNGGKTKGKTVASGDRKPVEISQRQKDYFMARAKGKTPAEAKAIAGYSPNTSTTEIEGAENYKHETEAFMSVLKGKGFDDDFLVETLMQKIKAKKSTFFFGAEVVGEENDHATNLKAIELILKIQQRLVDRVEHTKETKVVDWSDIEEMDDQELNDLLGSLTDD